MRVSQTVPYSMFNGTQAQIESRVVLSSWYSCFVFWSSRVWFPALQVYAEILT